MKKGLSFAVITLFIGIALASSITDSEPTSNQTIYSDENGTLSGYVKDTSLKPIDGAIIRTSCGENYFENVSDSSGYYYIDNIPLIFCLWNVSVSKTGYKTIWVGTGIGENTTYDFVLTSLDTIYVDDDGTADYTRIQDAIDNASEGDTVFVYNGTYFENIVVGKSIDLIGEDKNNTIIDGAGIGCCLMGIAENIYISGFAFTNSSKDDFALMFFDGQYTFTDNVISYSKGGIYCSDAEINVTKNIISNNEWGIAFENLYHSNIIGNIIQNNSDFGIGLFNCFYSVIQENQVSNNNYGIKITSSWSNIVNENNITNNTIGVGVEAWDEFSTGWNKILDNYIADNDRGVYLHAYRCGHVFNTVVAENSIINNEYGIFLASDCQPAELNLNNITKNLIKDNTECGIYLNNTYNNSISNNNFIFNKRTTYFENSYNTWNNNYWNRPRLLPYPIFGKMDSKLGIEWDWHPRLLPNNIGGDS